MAIVKMKPTSPGCRFVTKVVDPSLSKEKPVKNLTKSKKSTNGRNNVGRITVRHRGGAHKRKLREIDFKRDRDGIPGKVERLEYDPNRSSRIALILYADGVRRYIIAPKGLKDGDQVISGVESPIKLGNTLPLRNIPEGTTIHCVELKPLKGAQLARSAGTSARLLGKENEDYAVIKLSSGKKMRISLDCKATIGEVGNSEHSLRKLGKAGAKRHRGWRPTVRGVVMNPVDHPHGGGEGKTSGGRHPVTPWGKPTKGYKTRKNKRTDKFIVL